MRTLFIFISIFRTLNIWLPDNEIQTLPVRLGQFFWIMHPNSQAFWEETDMFQSPLGINAEQILVFFFYINI